MTARARTFGPAMVVLVTLRLAGVDPAYATDVGVPETLVTVRGQIEAFAQDDGNIAWTTTFDWESGECDERIHLLTLATGRKVALASRDGFICTDRLDDRLTQPRLLGTAGAVRGSAIAAQLRGVLYVRHHRVILV